MARRGHDPAHAGEALARRHVESEAVGIGDDGVGRARAIGNAGERRLGLAVAPAGRHGVAAILEEIDDGVVEIFVLLDHQNIHGHWKISPLWKIVRKNWSGSYLNVGKSLLDELIQQAKWHRLVDDGAARQI